MTSYQVGSVALASLVLAAFTFRSCDSEPKDLPVAQIGSRTISLSDFETLYLKSAGSLEDARSSTIEDRERFLELLVNYQLKVEEAYEQGYDKNPALVDELGRYHQSLAMTHVAEREVIRPAIDLLYERRKWEVRPRHILLKLEREATPEDTVEAYGRAMDLIQRLQAGESFADLARMFSADSVTGKENGGDLYYFIAGQMVLPFEEACYRLSAGEFTQLPVRTQFGYHIIQLINRQLNPGSVRLSNIFVQVSAMQPPADTLAAYKKIVTLLDSIQTHGRDFSEIAARHSEHRRSAALGGDLGLMTRRSIIQPLDSVTFSLAVGEVSPVIRSRFGYHILMATGKEPVPSKEEIEPELRRIVKQKRFETDYAKYLAGLKEEFGYRFNEDQFRYFLSKVDTTKTPSDSAWTSALSEEDRGRILVRFSPTEVSVGDFADELSSREEFLKTPLRELVLRKALDRVVEFTLMDIQGERLNRTNKTFRMTMEEFKDGSLLFEIEQAEIWGKLEVTEDSLRAYFAQHREQFQFPLRVEFAEVFVRKETIADSLYTAVLEETIPFDSVRSLHFRPAMRKTKGVWELRPADENELTKKATTLEIGKVSQPFVYQGGYSIIRLDRKEPPRLKTYEEAISEVASAYQDTEAKRLERQWLDRLRQKYPVTLHKDRLSLAFTRGETKP